MVLVQAVLMSPLSCTIKQKMKTYKLHLVCEFCGGQTVQRRITKQHWFHKQLYVIEDVLAEVCQECGERYFHVQVLDQIDQLLQTEHLVKARLQVEVVSLPPAAVAA